MDLLKMNVANETGQITTVTIEQAGKYDGQEVTLKGWLYNLRESGKLLFPIFRDGTGIIQGVCALKENPQAFESLKGLTQESSVIVTGKIRAEKRAPGGYEIGVTKIKIVQKVPKSILDAKRPALRGSHRHGSRQGLHLRPHVSRRKIKDPPPPHRILDARAGSRLHRDRRNHGARRRPGQRHRARRAEEQIARTRNAQARYGQTRKREAPFPAHQL